MSSAATVAGWVAAGLAGASMLIVRRSLGTRMEAVARACHELRGPLTAARLGLSFGERSGELSPDRLRAIDTELGRATLALQDLANVGQGGPRLRELERIDLCELMIKSVRAAFGLADEFGAMLSWEWDGPLVTIWADRLRLAQALGNLIANAIEHGGGHVHVRGAVSDVVAIEIVDDGPGLPAPVAELIRRPRRGRGARGRGLAIASAIAEAHGGRVATGPSGRGATVAFELPVPPAPLPR
jgi:signal transduction histidine kinase